MEEVINMRLFLLVLVAFFLFALSAGCVRDIIPGNNNDGEVSKGQEDVNEGFVKIEVEGISFRFEKSLAGSVDFTIVPASEEGDMIPYPKYALFTFFDPACSVNMYSEGYLFVLPAEPYSLVDNEADRAMAELSKILGSRSLDTAYGELPFLPFPNAGQLFYSNVDFIGFTGGKGIRYITQYVQDVSPIVSEGLIYTFQGITADSRYYVSLIMPVGNPNIIQTWSDFFDEADYEEFAENFHSYIEQDREILNNSPDSDFMPSLDLFDMLVDSILIDNPDFLFEEGQSVG